MRRENKKCFSLAELMIILVLVSLLITALIPVVTRKHLAIPKIGDHGAYFCYRNDEGKLVEELYNNPYGTAPTPVFSHTDVDECTFNPPRKAVYFQISAVGGGGGGGDSGYGGGSLYSGWSSLKTRSVLGLGVQDLINIGVIAKNFEDGNKWYGYAPCPSGAVCNTGAGFVQKDLYTGEFFAFAKDKWAGKGSPVGRIDCQQDFNPAMTTPNDCVYTPLTKWNCEYCPCDPYASNADNASIAGTCANMLSSPAIVPPAPSWSTFFTDFTESTCPIAYVSFTAPTVKDSCGLKYIDTSTPPVTTTSVTVTTYTTVCTTHYCCGEPGCPPGGVSNTEMPGSESHDWCKNNFGVESPAMCACRTSCVTQATSTYTTTTTYYPSPIIIENTDCSKRDAGDISYCTSTECGSVSVCACGITGRSTTNPGGNTTTNTNYKCCHMNATAYSKWLAKVKILYNSSSTHGSLNTAQKEYYERYIKCIEENSTIQEINTLIAKYNDCKTTYPGCDPINYVPGECGNNASCDLRSKKALMDRAPHTCNVTIASASFKDPQYTFRRIDETGGPGGRGAVCKATASNGGTIEKSSPTYNPYNISFTGTAIGDISAGSDAGVPPADQRLSLGNAYKTSSNIASWGLYNFNATNYGNGTNASGHAESKLSNATGDLSVAKTTGGAEGGKKGTISATRSKINEGGKFTTCASADTITYYDEDGNSQTIAPPANCLSTPTASGTFGDYNLPESPVSKLCKYTGTRSATFADASYNTAFISSPVYNQPVGGAKGADSDCDTGELTTYRTESTSFNFCGEPSDVNAGYCFKHHSDFYATYKDPVNNTSIDQVEPGYDNPLDTSIGVPKYWFRYSYDANYMTYGNPGNPGELKTVVVRSMSDINTKIKIGHGGPAALYGGDGGVGGDTSIGSIVIAHGGKGGKGNILDSTEVMPGYDKDRLITEQFCTNKEVTTATATQTAAFTNVGYTYNTSISKDENCVAFYNSVVKESSDPVITDISEAKFKYVRRSGASVNPITPEKAGWISNLYSFFFGEKKDGLTEEFLKHGQGGNGGYVQHNCWAGQHIIWFEGMYLPEVSIFPASITLWKRPPDLKYDAGRLDGSVPVTGVQQATYAQVPTGKIMKLPDDCRNNYIVEDAQPGKGGAILIKW